MGASGATGIATILNVLQTSQRHGPLRAIFTSGKNGDMSGAKNLDPSYLDGHCLIGLNGETTWTVNISSSYALTLNTERNLTATATQGRYAYVIAASGFSTGRVRASDYASRVNPVTIVSEVLTNAKSAGVFYELCEFSGGTDALHMPGEATAVVVVNDYEKKRFLQIFDSVEKTYRDRAEQAMIAMIETIIPPEAVSNEDADNALTFLFGLLSSDFSNGGDAAASLYINHVDLSPQRFSCEIAVLGADKDAAERIVKEQTNIEKLSYLPVSETDRVPGFATDPDGEAVRRMIGAYGKVLKSDCETGAGTFACELGYLHEKNPDLDILSIGVTIDGKDTPEESIDRATIAVPANAILEYLNTEARETL
jgi:dipeptidase D